MKCNEIIELFPDILKNPLQAAKVDLWETEEIRVRAGQCLSVRVRGREWRLEVRYTVEEIRQILSYLANYSLYAYEREIRQGYLTLPGGHRLGLVGRAVLEGDRITSLMEISALNLRLAHEKKGCADSVISCLWEQDNLCDTLVVSPPGGGKTTLLRDCIRQISDGTKEHRGRTVGVVDERSEIAGCCRGVPENDVGMRTDVLDGCPKTLGMRMLLRSMAPEVLAVDEIGSEEDVREIQYAANCGCTVFATVHGDSRDALQNQPNLRKLLETGAFQRLLFLEGRDAPGRIRQVTDYRGTVLC